LKSILLVEDSRFLRMAVEHSLVKAGYRVFAVGEGTAALQIAAEQVPDLILLDMLLPGLGGPEVLQALKLSPATSRIPVIVLSSLAQKNDAKLKRAGASAYFEKSKLNLGQRSEDLVEIVRTTLGDAIDHDPGHHSIPVATA
jgi:CheY-like chemotaxis protein